MEVVNIQVFTSTHLLAGVKVSFSPKLYQIIEIVEKIMVDTYCYSDENRQFKPNTAI